MSPLVSIILPTYNRAKEIKIAVNSVIRQTYMNWELIIIDNFSTDETYKEILKYKDKRINFYQIHNKGIIAKSRNFGLKKANGDIISFLDSDDSWTENKLKLAVNYIERGHEFTFHRLKIINNKKINLFQNKTYSFFLKKPVFENLLARGSCIPNSSVSLTHSLIKSINGFNESYDLIGAEDYDAWLRISKKTNKFFEIPSTLGFCLISQNNFSSDKNSLKNIKAIEKLHINNDSLNNIACSIDYTKARIYHRMGMYKDAIANYKNTLAKKPNIEIFVKTLIAMIILKLIMAVNKMFKSHDNK